MRTLPKSQIVLELMSVLEVKSEFEKKCETTGPGSLETREAFNRLVTLLITLPIDQVLEKVVEETHSRKAA